MKRNEYIDNELVELFSDCETIDDILDSFPLSENQRRRLFLLKNVIRSFMFALEGLKK